MAKSRWAKRHHSYYMSATLIDKTTGLMTDIVVYRGYFKTLVGRRLKVAQIRKTFGSDGVAFCYNTYPKNPLPIQG